MAKIKAAVIFGGVSDDYKLSCESAADVIESIPSDKYETVCIGITRKGRWLYYPGDPEGIRNGSWEYDTDCTSAFISPDPIYKGIVTIENGITSFKRLDVVFPLVMGKTGSDGTIQGLLDMSGITYVGSGLLSSAVCMDKSQTHMILDKYNIRTADWSLITQREINYLDRRCEDIAGEIGFPLAVKPASSAGARGLRKVDTIAELMTAVKNAFSFDSKVVVEKYIGGRELEVAVFGYDTPFSSFIGEIVSDDCDEKSGEHFVSESGNMVIADDLDNNVINKIRETAVSAYKALGCKGLARVDFFMDVDEGLYLNKVNTMPGMKKDCIYPLLMKHLGMEMPYLADKLLEQAIDNSEKEY